MPFRGWRDRGAGMVFMETLFRFSALHFRSVLHFGLCSFVREMDGLILDDFICKYVLTYARGTMHLQSSTVDNARVFSFLFYFSIIPFCYFFLSARIITTAILPFPAFLFFLTEGKCSGWVVFENLSLVGLQHQLGSIFARNNNVM